MFRKGRGGRVELEARSVTPGHAGPLIPGHQALAFLEEHLRYGAKSLDNWLFMVLLDQAPDGLFSGKDPSSPFLSLSAFLLSSLSLSVRRNYLLVDPVLSPFHPVQHLFT